MSDAGLCLPLCQLRCWSAGWEPQVRDWCSAVATELNLPEYAQILRGLPIKRGGLSLARCETIAKPAYAASFLGSLKHFNSRLWNKCLELPEVLVDIVDVLKEAVPGFHSFNASTSRFVFEESYRPLWGISVTATAAAASAPMQSENSEDRISDSTRRHTLPQWRSP